jgi:release factor glutamine methyltransferase
MALAEHLAPEAETMGARVASAAARLTAAGVDTARLDAEVLLAAACGTDRTALYAAWHRAVPGDRHTRFEALLTRRLAREPLQYIVGRQEFWSLEFAVSPAVLIPRPETELLIELALHVLASRSGSPPYQRTVDFLGVDTPRYAARKGRLLGVNGSLSISPDLFRSPREGPISSRAVSRGRSHLSSVSPNLHLCDLGTGSGCIAVTLARELPNASVWACDLSAAALAVAATNARHHHVADRVQLIHSHLFAMAGDLCFDVIVANPPYVRSDALRQLQPELAWEPAQALDGGASGLDVIERVVARSPAHLRPGGWLIMEIGADQGNAVERMAHRAGFSAVSVAPDYAGHPRALVARKA